MNKWYGEIGFAEQVETCPGVWVETISPHYYYGDIVQNNRRYQSTTNLNDNITISNRISILADSFTYHNSHLIRYVEFMGIRWKVSNIEVQYPRLILTLGDVYNDNE